MGLKESLYRYNMIKMLPPGKAFKAPKDSEIESIFGGVAKEFDRAEDTVRTFGRELDPRTAYSLLSDWEEFVQIPDDCQKKSTDLGTRRKDVQRKLTIGGGQNAAFYKRLCSMFGYDVEVKDLPLFRAGRGRAGERLWGPAFLHVFNIRALDITVNKFRAGQSVAGSPLSSWENENLERVVNRSKPAHTKVIFTYGGSL